jgi:hypothetical protein
MTQDQIKEWYKKHGIGDLIGVFTAHGSPLPEPPAATLRPAPGRPKGGDLTCLEGWHPQARKIEGFLESAPKVHEYYYVPKKSFNTGKILASGRSKMEPTKTDSSSYDSAGNHVMIDSTWD